MTVTVRVLGVEVFAITTDPNPDEHHPTAQVGTVVGFTADPE